MICFHDMTDMFKIFLIYPIYLRNGPIDLSAYAEVIDEEQTVQFVTVET